MWLSWAWAVAAPHLTVAPPLNVLYIVAHDVRADLSAPNLELLAREGTCFPLAFAQAPFCVPSRHSFLTGRRPAATGVHTFKPGKPDAGYWPSLPGAFRRAGYVTLGVGHMLGPGVCKRCWTWQSPPSLLHSGARERRALHDRDASLLAVRLVRRLAGLDARATNASGGGDLPAAIAPHRPWFLALGLVQGHEPHLPSGKLMALARARARNQAAARAFRITPPSGASAYTVPQRGYGVWRRALTPAVGAGRAQTLLRAIASYQGLDFEIGQVLRWGAAAQQPRRPPRP